MAFSFMLNKWPAVSGTLSALLCAVVNRVTHSQKLLFYPHIPVTASRQKLWEYKEGT